MTRWQLRQIALQQKIDEFTWDISLWKNFNFGILYGSPRASPEFVKDFADELDYLRKRKKELQQLQQQEGR